jgi:carbon storage regulator
MLVLTRRIGETIVVPEFELTVTVLESRGNQVRLGITAPRSVAIHRSEVWRRVAEFQDFPVRDEAPIE